MRKECLGTSLHPSTSVCLVRRWLCLCLAEFWWFLQEWLRFVRNHSSHRTTATRKMSARPLIISVCLVVYADCPVLWQSRRTWCEYHFKCLSQREQLYRWSGKVSCTESTRCTEWQGKGRSQWNIVWSFQENAFCLNEKEARQWACVILKLANRILFHHNDDDCSTTVD